MRGSEWGWSREGKRSKRNWVMKGLSRGGLGSELDFNRMLLAAVLRIDSSGGEQSREP